MSLIAEQLSYRVKDRLLLDNVSLSATAGELHAVLGPNGAGKSTLLRLLSGEWAPSSGKVLFDGRPLHQWAPQALARVRAVLPQRETLNFSFTAEEVVALGRLPHRAQEPALEQAIIDAAIATAGVSHLSTRQYPTLSGGERSRVQLARVLTQIWQAPAAPASRCLLLDEPTASLDLAHQHHCLQIARELSKQKVAVLAVLHDPNLVLAYADRVTVLCCGQVVASGVPTEVLTPALLSRIYGIPVQVWEIPDSGQRWIQAQTHA